MHSHKLGSVLQPCPRPPSSTSGTATTPSPGAGTPESSTSSPTAEQADKEQVRPYVSPPPPNDVVEPSGHQHHPLPVAEEAFHQATHNRLPIHTVENAALRQTPNPVEEAANYPQHLAGEAVEYPQHQVPYVAGDYDVFPLLEEQQRVVFLLSHILLRRFFLPHLLPYKCLLFGQCTTKRVMVKVMLKTPMSIFKYNLTIIYLALPSHLLLQYPLQGQLTAIPSPSSYLVL